MDIHILLIHSSVDGHLSCFQSLARMNNAAMDTHVQVFTWTYVLELLGYTVTVFIPSLLKPFPLAFQYTLLVLPSNCPLLSHAESCLSNLECSGD